MIKNILKISLIVVFLFLANETFACFEFNNLSIRNQTDNNKAEIIKLQILLKSVGAYTGPITGYYGSLTEAVIKEIQKSENLPATGTIDARTKESICFFFYKCPFNANLKRNDITPRREIESLQAFLSFYKEVYARKLVTGFYGNLTEEAVKNFQRSFNLSQTGQVDESTRRALCQAFDTFTNQELTKSTPKTATATPRATTSTFQSICIPFPREPKTNQPVTFISQILGGVAPYTYQWSGDVSGNNRTITNTFTREGSYAVNLKVTDKNGNVSESRCNISIGEGLLGRTADDRIAFPTLDIEVERIERVGEDILRRVEEVLSPEQREKYLIPTQDELVQLLIEEEKRHRQESENMEDITSKYLNKDVWLKIAVIPLHDKIAVEDLNKKVINRGDSFKIFWAAGSSTLQPGTWGCKGTSSPTINSWKDDGAIHTFGFSQINDIASDLSLSVECSYMKEGKILQETKNIKISLGRKIDDSFLIKTNNEYAHLSRLEDVNKGRIIENRVENNIGGVVVVGGSRKVTYDVLINNKSFAVHRFLSPRPVSGINFNYRESPEKTFTQNARCSIQSLINLIRGDRNNYSQKVWIGDIRSPEYSCNEIIGRCVIVPYATGKYSSLASCENDCSLKHKITRYSCNILTRQCEQSFTGLYGSYSNCAKDCKVLEFKNTGESGWPSYKIDGTVPDYSIVFSNQRLPDLVPFVSYFRGHTSYKSMDHMAAGANTLGDVSLSTNEAKNFKGSGGIWKVLNEEDVYSGIVRDEVSSHNKGAENVRYNEVGEAIIEVGIANVGEKMSGISLFAGMVGDPVKMPGDGSDFSGVKLTHHLYPLTWTPRNSWEYIDPNFSQTRISPMGCSNTDALLAQQWRSQNIEDIWKTYGFFYNGLYTIKPIRSPALPSSAAYNYLNYATPGRTQESRDPFKWHEGVDRMGEFSWSRSLDSSNIFHVPEIKAGDRFRTWFRFRCQDNNVHRIYFVADPPQYTDNSPQDICNLSYTEGQTDGKIMKYNILTQSNPTRKSQINYFEERYFDDMYLLTTKNQKSYALSLLDIERKSKSFLPIEPSFSTLKYRSHYGSCWQYRENNQTRQWEGVFNEANCNFNNIKNNGDNIAIGMVREKFDEWNNMAYIDIKCNCFPTEPRDMGPVCFSPDLINYVPAKKPPF